MGKLRVGQTHCANVEPGRYLIGVKEPNIFVGSVTKAEAVVEVKSGQSTYVRYAMDFAGMQMIGTVANVSTENSLQIVDEASWQQRL